MAADAIDTAPAPADGAPAPAPEPTPAPSAPDWRTGLPPDLQAEKSLERYKDVGGLAKAYVEVERRIGAPLEAPAPDAKPEVVAAYRKRIGVPETPDKYEVTLPTPPEGSGMQWDERWLGTLKSRLHATHARPAVVQAVVNTFAEYMAEHWDKFRAQQVQAEQTDLSESVKALEQKWGPRGGPTWRHYQGRAEAAIRTLMSDAPPAAVQRVVETANDPEVAHAFALVAEGLLERGFIGPEDYPAAMTAEDAQAKVEAMRAAYEKDPGHPLKNERHPEHDRIFKQWLEWNRIASGTRRAR